MIIFLRGLLADKKPNRVSLDVNGVGYEAGISTQTYAGLPPTGKELFLHIYHHMTESEQRLFGFTDSTEKSLFELLITVKGVGPRLALTILSGMQASEILASIARQDAAMLARTPGIGKKTAERLILELRDKVSTAGSVSPSAVSNTPVSARSEAISALEALGFKRVDAESAVQKAAAELPEDTETGDLVRAGLRLLYK
jgi:Holliday junction DNA helicase RuvA